VSISPFQKASQHSVLRNNTFGRLLDFIIEYLNSGRVAQNLKPKAENQSKPWQ